MFAVNTITEMRGVVVVFTVSLRCVDWRTYKCLIILYDNKLSFQIIVEIGLEKMFAFQNDVM